MFKWLVDSISFSKTFHGRGEGEGVLELSETFRLLIFFALLRDGFKKEKKKLMEFSIKKKHGLKTLYFS